MDDIELAALALFITLATSLSAILLFWPNPERL
jgi:hypothetical protein